MRGLWSIAVVLCACASTTGGRSEDAQVVADSAHDTTSPLDDAAHDGMAGDAPTDAMTDAMVDAMTDAMVDAPPAGPVSIGAYTYTAVNASGLVSPPAVAWHPSGSYALVLNYSDKVYRYEPVGHTLTEVASAG